MEKDDFPVYVFNTHVEAEEAVKALSQSGFDVKKLSIIGKGYHSEEKPIGFYTTGDRVKAWGGMGAFWGAMWGLLIAPAVFFFPGFGLVAFAGPIVAVLVSALEGAALVGGVSAIGAALMQIGVPTEQVMKYEMALKVDKYVLMVHGSFEEQDHARTVLEKTKSWEMA